MMKRIVMLSGVTLLGGCTLLEVQPQISVADLLPAILAILPELGTYVDQFLALF